ncbi:MAG: DUF1189 family protein [Candidatus Omnitrophica bacterium]|nr:DUF1189 family protein [Candidatus Omnitrophota bacterium]
MNAILAPLRALSSLEFYRKVLKNPFWHCLAYLGYLSLLASFVVWIAFSTRIAPMMDDFMIWFRASMPTVSWMPEGISIDRQSPYTMTHPKFGPVMTFDMNRTDVTSETMGVEGILVTSKKVYVRQSSAELRVYDLTAAAKKNDKLPANFTIDETTVGDWYAKVKPWAGIISAVFYFPFFFMWKILTAFFYSLVGNLFNLSRKPRLVYSSVFKLSVYAMTASIVFEWLQMLVPALDRIPLGLMGGLIITSGYLFLAVKKTEPAENSAV